MLPDLSKGKAQKFLTLTCGVCGKFEIVEFTDTSANSLIEKLTDENWRISTNHGYIHRQCEKRMPAQIKFELSTSEPTETKPEKTP